MRGQILGSIAIVALLAIGCARAPSDGADFEEVPKQENDIKGKGEAETEGEGGGARETPPAAASTSLPTTPANGGPITPAPTGDDRVGRMSFGGTLSATQPKAFGDSAGCRYTVTMNDVKVTVAIEDGKVVSAEVGSRMVEKTPSCPTPVIPPNAHDFAMSSQVDVSKLAEGGRINVPMKATHVTAPSTLLTFGLVKKGTSYEAALTWRRNDDVASTYLWTVTTTLPLVVK